MNAKNMLAAFLIALGLVIFTSSGISFTTARQSIMMFGLQVEKKDHHHVPPAVGLITIMGGMVLRLIKLKQFEKRVDSIE